MIRDVYLRFKDERSVTAFFRAAPGIGNMFSDTETDRLVDVRGSSALVQLPAGSVVVEQGTYDEEGLELTAPVYDDAIWVVLRLLGAVAKQDSAEGSRWEARLSRHVRDGGVEGFGRGARMSRRTKGQTWVEVYNLDDLIALDIVPHVIAGGPL